MAVRQYIGARYVIKIYENSVDPASAEWESSVNYEPLTMVTYNYGSYLSKKEVPASVGNPADNPTYWVQTGFYNGQIASLQSQIDDINNNKLPDVTAAIQTVSDNVGDLEDFNTSDKTSIVKAINSLSFGINKRYVLIMDSYGGYPDETLLDAIKEKLNIADDDAIYQGGIGFTNVNGQGTFETLLTGSISQFTDKDKVDGVIVLGGANDYGGNLTNIRNAISSFCTYTKTQFPNAEIMIGCLSRAYQDRANADAHKVAINAYRSCFAYGARYLNNTEFIMHWKVLYYDFVHPATTSAPRIADAVYQAVVFGSCDIEYNASIPLTSKSLTGIFSAMSVPTGAAFDQHIYNGAGMFNSSGFKMTLTGSSVSLSSNDVDLEETLADASILFTGNTSSPYRIALPCNFAATLSGTEVRRSTCIVYLYDIGHVHVKFFDTTAVTCDSVAIDVMGGLPVDVSYC